MPIAEFPQNSWKIAIWGEEAFVAPHGAGLMVLDLSDPLSLSPLGPRIPVPGLYVGSIAASQKFVVVSTRDGGVVIFERMEPGP